MGRTSGAPGSFIRAPIAGWFAAGASAVAVITVAAVVAAAPVNAANAKPAMHTTSPGASSCSAAYAASSPAALQMGVPAYFYSTTLWSEAVQHLPQYMILNPDSGPGTAPDPHFSQQASEARSAGICLLGYVPTNYGRISLPTVERQISEYRDWYGITSVFLDETPWTTSAFSYYSKLAGYIRQTTGSLVAMNPGCVPDESYATLADLLVVFEGSASEFTGWTPPAWSPTSVHARLWDIVYSAPGAGAAQVSAAAASRGASVAYVTDGGLPNPYDSLPSWW